MYKLLFAGILCFYTLQAMDPSSLFSARARELIKALHINPTEAPIFLQKLPQDLKNEIIKFSIEEITSDAIKQVPRDKGGLAPFEFIAQRVRPFFTNPLLQDSGIQERVIDLIDKATPAERVITPRFAPRTKLEDRLGAGAYGNYQPAMKKALIASLLGAKLWLQSEMDKSKDMAAVIQEAPSILRQYNSAEVQSFPYGLINAIHTFEEAGVEIDPTTSEWAKGGWKKGLLRFGE